MASNYDGLPIGNTVEERIMVDAALEWVKNNTTMEIDPDSELPSNVKLFVMKFNEVMSAQAGVTSESLGGMSQSFDTSDKTVILRQYASELLSPYYSCAKFVPVGRRWF